MFILFAAIYNPNLDKAIPYLISEMNALNDPIHYGSSPRG